MARTVVAGDFGGTNLRAALVAESGEVLARREVPTPAAGTAEEALASVDALLADIRAGAAESPVAACIAAAGLIDAERGLVLVSPNVHSFRNLPLGEALAKRTGLPAAIENDASAAALGEHRFGAARGARHVLHATLGTGIGGGIVIDGRLHRGAAGLAGEIGHVVIDAAGPVCACGSRGCIEALAGGVAFGRRAQRLLESGAAPALAGLCAGREPTAADLARAAARGDTAALAEIRNGGHLLGVGLAGLVNVLNPDVVTLSGGLLGMGEPLLESLREAMAANAYGPAAATPVRVSELGEDAGLLGAAAVALALAEG